MNEIKGSEKNENKNEKALKGSRLKFSLLISTSSVKTNGLEQRWAKTGMNEWSPKQYYSGSATSDQRPQGKTYRTYWEESREQVRTAPAFKNMNGCKNKEFLIPTTAGMQNCIDESNILGYSCKKKKNGISDPRFKRVINSEYRSEAEFEREKLTAMPHESSDQTIDVRNDNVTTYLNSPKSTSIFTSTGFTTSRQELVTKDIGFRPSSSSGFQYHYYCHQEPEKVKSNAKANLKRSASDCTLHTKKAFREVNEVETIDKVRTYPSATRLSKVHNWIRDYSRVLPEKRRSVITVIGQTQTKPFSKILSEIKQRRKLAKELDKHAMCEAIMESAENHTDVKNLVAKVDFVLPDGKVIYTAEKVYLCKDNIYRASNVFSQKSVEYLDSSAELKRKRCEMIPERDSSTSQLGKRSRPKRSNKKLASCTKETVLCKGEMKNLFKRLSCKLLWSFVLLLCLTIAVSAFLFTFKPPNPYYLVDMFKPKTTAWYERLLF